MSPYVLVFFLVSSHSGTTGDIELDNFEACLLARDAILETHSEVASHPSYAEESWAICLPAHPKEEGADRD